MFELTQNYVTILIRRRQRREIVSIHPSSTNFYTFATTLNYFTTFASFAMTLNYFSTFGSLAMTLNYFYTFGSFAKTLNYIFLKLSATTLSYTTTIIPSAMTPTYATNLPFYAPLSALTDSAPSVCSLTSRPMFFRARAHW